MDSARTCPSCGVAPMLRNGRRTLTVPRLGEDGVTWHRLDAARLDCRSCGRSCTDREGLRSELEGGLRRGIVRRLGGMDLDEVSAWAGCDRRTTAGYARAEMDAILCRPLPSSLSVLAGGRLVVLADAGTGILVDALGSDSVTFGQVLAERGGGVERIELPLVPALRDAAREVLPQAVVALHRRDALSRLDALLRDAAGRRDDGSAALLAERVRSRGWDAAAVDRLSGIAARQGSRMFALFMGAWGGELRETLMRPRDGPVASLPACAPLRARAIVAAADAGGVTVSELISALGVNTAKGTQRP